MSKESPAPWGGSAAFSPPPLPHRADTVHLRPDSQPPLPPPPSYPPPPYSAMAEEGRQTGSHHISASTPPDLPPRQPAAWSNSRDPRSSSTQSLTPTDSARHSGRRTLLLVYIHGFLGNEMSFQSFPAHVHNLVTVMLNETHVVHTKIYPRYKSRKAIQFARDDFSNWLAPHESDETDVILLGHSMGGILSAEVVLLPPYSPASGRAFRHRILGTINFDTPFLGMHPGVVVSGLSSLFRPVPDATSTTPVPVQTSASAGSSGYFGAPLEPNSSSASASAGGAALSPFASPSPSDPNYDPPFPNDIRMPIRTGWDNALHFVTKHSDGLFKASRQYVMSHLEFGGCLADYKGLKVRYAKIRALEDVDDHADQEVGGMQRPKEPRRRFVNYYTASSGRPKKEQSPGRHGSGVDQGRKPVEVEMQDLSVGGKNRLTPSSTPSPRISVEEHRGNEIISHDITNDLDEPPTDDRTPASRSGAGSPAPSLHRLSPGPASDTDLPLSAPVPASDSDIPPSVPEQTAPQDDPMAPSRQTTSQDDSLPAVPPLPQPPLPFNPSGYSSKDALKLAEKAHSRAVKAHKQAVKDRDSALKDRRKVLAKREKEREKQVRTEEKQRLREEKQSLRDEEQAQRGLNKENTAPASQSPASSEKAPQSKPKDKKFCVLPPKDRSAAAAANGSDGRDPAWIRVYMDGVDEVGAHCGLFFAGEVYERLVGDVGGRIEAWVRQREGGHAQIG